MDGFTLIDGLVAGIVLGSAILAYSRGLAREALAIAGWIGAGVVAYVFAEQAQPLVREGLRYIPKLGASLAESCELSMIASFFVVLTAALVMVSFLVPLFSSMIQHSVIGGIDRALGFLFGALRGLLLAMVAFFTYQTVGASQEIAMIDNSRIAALFTPYINHVEGQDPQAAIGWIEAQYDGLMGRCEGR